MLSCRDVIWCQLQDVTSSFYLAGWGGRKYDVTSLCWWRNQKTSDRSIVMVSCNIPVKLYHWLRELTFLSHLESLCCDLQRPGACPPLWSYLLPLFSFPIFLKSFSHLQFFKPTKLSVPPQGLCTCCSLSLACSHSTFFCMHGYFFLPFRFQAIPSQLLTPSSFAARITNIITHIFSQNTYLLNVCLPC